MEYVQGNLKSDAAVLKNIQTNNYTKISARKYEYDDNEKFLETKRDYEIAHNLNNEVPGTAPQVFDFRMGPCPDIIKLEQVDASYECVTFSSKTVPGKTLAALLNTISLTQFHKIFIDLFTKHSQFKGRFTHYDLHPANLIVDLEQENDDPKSIMIDFGSSFYKSLNGEVWARDAPDYGIGPIYFWAHDAFNLIARLLIHYDPKSYINKFITDYFEYKLRQKVRQQAITEILAIIDGRYNLSRKNNTAVKLTYNLDKLNPKYSFKQTISFPDRLRDLFKIDIMSDEFLSELGWLKRDNLLSDSNEYDLLTALDDIDEDYGYAFLNPDGSNIVDWLNKILDFFPVSSDDLISYPYLIKPQPKFLQLDIDDFILYLKEN